MANTEVIKNCNMLNIFTSIAIGYFTFGSRLATLPTEDNNPSKALHTWATDEDDVSNLTSWQEVE